MLPAPVLSRSVGLPTNPRPQRAMRNSPYNPPTDLPSASSTPNNPSYTALHTRSRSQPPRTMSSPRHGHSASTITRVHKDNDLYDPKLRGCGRVKAKARLPKTFHGRASPEKPLRLPSPAPSSTENPPISETPYVRTAARKAAIGEPSGDGRAIWNTVSSVASALTVSVSKAWNTNITTFSGEETPPGQESRLTRAMKAYHIARAHSRSDLPDWLFDERERRAASVSSEPGDNPVQSRPPVQNNIRQNSASSERLTSVPVPTESAYPQSQLRGADRLKAMREVKRRLGRDTSEFPADHNHQANTSSYVPHPVTQDRIGLPSRPQGRKR